MSFTERLNQYLLQLNLTAKDLSDASGLSISTISRYLSGESEPASDGKSLQKPAHGIAVLSENRQGMVLSEKDIMNELYRSLRDGNRLRVLLQKPEPVIKIALGKL